MLSCAVVDAVAAVVVVIVVVVVVVVAAAVAAVVVAVAVAVSNRRQKHATNRSSTIYTIPCKHTWPSNLHYSNYHHNCNRNNNDITRHHN